MIWTLIIAVILNVIHAFIDGARIKSNLKKGIKKDINHLPGAIIYSVLCGIVALVFGNIWYLIQMLFIRPVFYNPLLSILRFLPLFYVSLTTTSKVDQAMNMITENGFVQWLIWVWLTAVSIWLIQVL